MLYFDYINGGGMKINGLELLGIEWFNDIGIARVRNEVGEIKYYIKSVEGFSEEDDTMNVVAYGNKFPKVAGDALFGVV